MKKYRFIKMRFWFFMVLSLIIMCLAGATHALEIKVSGRIVNGDKSPVEAECKALLLKADLSVNIVRQTGKFEIKGDEGESAILFQSMEVPFIREGVLYFSSTDMRQVKMDVYDVLGKHIFRIMDRQMPGGMYSLQPLAFAEKPLKDYLYVLVVRIGSDRTYFKPLSVSNARSDRTIKIIRGNYGLLAKKTAGLDILKVQCIDFSPEYIDISDYKANMGDITLTDKSENLYTEDLLSTNAAAIRKDQNEE
jgi:hypothetical protein